MFRVVLPHIIRSAYNSIYSMWYLSHRYCYLPLSWKSWNWFECAVGGVRQILQPGLNEILTKSTAQTTKPECLLEEPFQVPGRAEQGRGKGLKRVTRRRSIFSLLNSYVRGSRLNMAHKDATLLRRQ
jgi:hypothetical protein